MHVTTTELAEKLGLSKGRVSQLVASGKLEGTYTGSGRQRRFDLDAAAAALGRKLDRGQMLGNGAKTRARLGALQSTKPAADEPHEEAAPQRDGSELPLSDPSRYELARTQKAEEEARKLRRQNAALEGQFVLASEVAQQVGRQIAQEVAQVETMLRDAARAVADELGVDYLRVRQVLTATWRTHRAERAETVAKQAAGATMTDQEREEDI